MRIGVSTYSFSRLVRSCEMKLIEVIGKAKELGFDAIEFATITAPEGKNLADFVGELKAETERVGIPIAGYSTEADFLNVSEENLNAEIERVKRHVDIAEMLGAPGIRHDAANGVFPVDWKGAKTFAAALPRIADSCRVVTEYAAAKGIKTMIENHGYFCQDSERIEQIVNAVNHENFGVLLDIGNFICADDNPGIAVGRLKNYAFHCHAKNFHLKAGSEVYPGTGWNMTRGGNWRRAAIIGHGNVPVLQCLRILAKNDYQGALSIEFEGIEEVLNGIKLSGENLRRFVNIAQNS